jgi:hypothetical protein
VLIKRADYLHIIGFGRQTDGRTAKIHSLCGKLLILSTCCGEKRTFNPRECFTLAVPTMRLCGE